MSNYMCTSRHNIWNPTMVVSKIGREKRLQLFAIYTQKSKLLEAYLPLNLPMPADFTTFERKIFPLWAENLKYTQNLGEFGWKFGKRPNLYGVADVLISKYILGEAVTTESEKDQWAAVINRFQDPKTGWYHALFPVHYKEHTTAYATAALKLIGRTPKYPFKFLEEITHSQKAMTKWANHINWSAIWPGSHVISGVPACLAMTEGRDHPFFEWLFEWLDKEVSPDSGFWERGLIHRLGIRRTPTYKEMAGAFHMYYIYEYFGRAWRFPQKIIDYTLAFQHANGLWDNEVTYCVDLDGVYCLTRSSRIAQGHREPEIKAAIERYLATASRILDDAQFFFRHYTSSHRLPGALAAIAECQKFYPELVKTARPWVQTLDQACFI